MHVETYPVTLAPRDEEPSLSSSKEKSSEFDWLERKRNENEKRRKNRARLCIFYIFIYLYPVGLHDALRTSSRELYIKKIYKTKYLRLFTPFPNLITKESYNWWVIRRRMEIYTKISEEKI